MTLILRRKNITFYYLILDCMLFGIIYYYIVFKTHTGLRTNVYNILRCFVMYDFVTNLFARLVFKYVVITLIFYF